MSDNSVFCRECNAQNPASNKFCSNCGASLKAATHITCPNCYHRNPLHLLYCDNCGTRLVRETPLDEGPEADDTQPLNIPTGFSLPSRSPGDTADLDPDSLPEWLKTGDASGKIDNEQANDWFEELKTSTPSSTQENDDFLGDDSDFGSIDLDWMSDDSADTEADETEEDDFDLFEDEAAEPEQPATTDTSDFTLTGIVTPRKEGEDFDWLSVMGEIDTDEPPVESPPTGFTGLLSPDALKAFEEQNFEGQEDEAQETGADDWLLEDSDSAPAADVFLFDETDDNDQDQPYEEGTAGFTDWLQQTTIETDDEEIVANDIPDWLAPPAELSKPTAASTDDSWLAALDDDDSEDPGELDLDVTGSDEGLPDWLNTPQTGPLATGNSGSTGFTGWLSAQSIDDFEAQQNQPSRTPSAAEESNDVPDWLQTPPEDNEKESGTGFTDWLMESGDANRDVEDEGDEFAEDDEFDWLDQEATQELMKPLTTEEAEKLLQDTPDVSDDFIKEVVGGDFPDWLTDVENVGDPGDTGVLPAWISAPVSESDTLTLGLGRDMLLPNNKDTDEWLADLAGSSSGEENDWFSELATSTAAADDNFDVRGGFEEADEEEAADDFADISDASAVDDAGEDDWLAGMPGLDSESATGADESDWLADMPGLSAESSSAENLDDLFESLPAFGETGAYNDEALDNAFGEMEYPEEAAADDWLADMPEEEEQDTVGWMSSFGSLEASPGKAVAALDWLNEPVEEDAEQDEPLSLDEEEEVKDPTYIDPAFDFTSFTEEAAETAERADSGELDWLSMMESTTGEHAAVGTSSEEEDAEAWLMGADLEDDSTGTFVIDESLHAVVFKPDEPEESYPDDDTDTLGDSWERDLLTPILEEDTEDILQELRALRTTDRLDPSVVEEVRHDEADPEIAEFINEKQSSVIPAARPNWIKEGADGLSTWSIDPLERDEPRVQQGGPLDGLAGVVGIAPAIAAVPTAIRPQVSTVTFPADEAHQQHAALLRQLTRAEWQRQPAAEAKEQTTSATTRANTLVQLIVGLLIIIAVLIGLLTPSLLPTMAPPLSPETNQLNTVLQGLQNETVLVAFEYSPAFAGELNSQAQLLLQELANNGNDVLLMSQYPTGLANARPLVETINGLQSSEIGYVPGEALGLRELATCLGQASCQTAAGQPLALGQVGAVVVLTGERDSLINWLEQVEPQTSVPVILGVTEALAPLARPYVVSEQINGLIAGLPATAAYEQAYQSQNSIGRLFQAQTLAKIVAILIILSGVIVALLPKKSTTTE